jgi:hypothetical protein
VIYEAIRLVASIGFGGGFLEIGMMVAVGLFELLDRHSETAGNLPYIDTALHQPRSAGVAQDMRDNVGRQAGLGAASPKRLFNPLDCLALASMDHWTTIAVKPLPAAQVRQQPGRQAH